MNGTQAIISEILLYQNTEREGKRDAHLLFSFLFLSASLIQKSDAISV